MNSRCLKPFGEGGDCCRALLVPSRSRPQYHSDDSMAHNRLPDKEAYSKNPLSIVILDPRTPVPTRLAPDKNLIDFRRGCARPRPVRYGWNGRTVGAFVVPILGRSRWLPLSMSPVLGWSLRSPPGPLPGRRLAERLLPGRDSDFAANGRTGPPGRTPPFFSRDPRIAGCERRKNADHSYGKMPLHRWLGCGGAGRKHPLGECVLHSLRPPSPNPQPRPIDPAARQVPGDALPFSAPVRPSRSSTQNSHIVKDAFRPHTSGGRLGSQPVSVGSLDGAQAYTSILRYARPSSGLWMRPGSSSFPPVLLD